MSDHFSILTEKFKEKFNDATEQVVNLQLSAINLQAKVSSLKPWDSKGWKQLDDQKDLRAKITELQSKVNQINESINELNDQEETGMDDSDILLAENLNKQGKQINSIIDKISLKLANIRTDLIEKSFFAAIADFFDELGQVLGTIVVQSIKFTKKAVKLLPEEQEKAIKKIFGEVEKRFLRKGKD